MKDSPLIPLEKTFERNGRTLNCPDFEIARECENLCIDDLLHCLSKCKNDSNCESECYREEIDCIDWCPCHVWCPQGRSFDSVVF